MTTIICARCGKEVPHTGRAQKYCPDCAKAAKGERDRVRTFKPPARLRRPDNALSDINAKARAAGMTYGKYVAMYGR